MIKTPETHPDHHTVGHYFAGHSYGSNRTEIYFCDSYDSSCGYWMTCVTNENEERRNVSERAIDRTFHRAEDRENHFYCFRWNIKVLKNETQEKGNVS